MDCATFCRAPGYARVVLLLRQVDLRQGAEYLMQRHAESIDLGAADVDIDRLVGRMQVGDDDPVGDTRHVAVLQIRRALRLGDGGLQVGVSVIEIQPVGVDFKRGSRDLQDRIVEGNTMVEQAVMRIAPGERHACGQRRRQLGQP